MTTDELDRILASADGLEPSSGLTGAVMAAVRRSAAEPPPLPFPWGRFAVGVGACSILAAAGTVLVPRLETALAAAVGFFAPVAAIAPELGSAALAVLVGLGVARLPRLFVRL